jgi:hypothetical protein
MSVGPEWPNTWVRHRQPPSQTWHPTAEWTAQQLREAFPIDQVPRDLLRDRDRIFGHTFRAQVKNMQIKEVFSAPRSPWQRAYVEGVIGSIRRECLDHVIVFGEASLRRNPVFLLLLLSPNEAASFPWTTMHRSLGRSSDRSSDQW